MTRIDIPPSTFARADRDNRHKIASTLLKATPQTLAKLPPYRLITLTNAAYQLADILAIQVPAVWVSVKLMLLRDGLAVWRDGELVGVREVVECPHCGRKFERKRTP